MIARICQTCPAMAIKPSNVGAALSKQQAAEFLGIAVRTLDEWIRRKRIPYSKLPSGIVRFRPEHLVAFLEKYEVKAGGTP